MKLLQCLIIFQIFFKRHIIGSVFMLLTSPGSYSIKRWNSMIFLSTILNQSDMPEIGMVLPSGWRNTPNSLHSCVKQVPYVRSVILVLCGPI